MIAPPELATRFLREVAEYVDRADAAEPRLWEDAAGADIKAWSPGSTSTSSGSLSTSPSPSGRRQLRTMPSVRA